MTAFALSTLMRFSIVAAAIATVCGVVLLVSIASVHRMTMAAIDDGAVSRPSSEAPKRRVSHDGTRTTAVEKNEEMSS